MNKNIFEMGKGNKQTVDSRGNTTHRWMLDLISIQRNVIKAKWNTILYLFKIF